MLDAESVRYLNHLYASQMCTWIIRPGEAKARKIAKLSKGKPAPANRSSKAHRQYYCMHKANPKPEALYSRPYTLSPNNQA